jgi:hypothetical protein
LNAALTAAKSPARNESPLPADFVSQEPYEKGWSARKAIVLGRSSTGEVTFLFNGPAASQYYEHQYQANITCRDCDTLVWKQLGTQYKLVLQAKGDRAGDYLAFEPTSTNGERDLVLRAGQTENMSMLRSIGTMENATEFSLAFRKGLSRTDMTCFRHTTDHVSQKSIVSRMSRVCSAF